VLFSERGERVLGLLADREQFTFERVLIGRPGPARDEGLADHRHLLDHRNAEPVEIGRDIAPADQALAFLVDEPLELRDREVARRLVLREEAHRHGVIARRRQAVASAICPVAKQRIGKLNQDPRPVAQQGIGADRTAVVQIEQDFETLFDDTVGFLALDVRDKADAAGVMFVPGVV
jgi:hypothetical protein